MNDAANAHVIQGLQQLRQQVNLARQRLPLPGIDDGLRVVQQFHCEEGLPLGIKSVVQHADDMRMLQGCECLKLLREFNAAVTIRALQILTVGERPSSNCLRATVCPVRRSRTR